MTANLQRNNNNNSIYYLQSQSILLCIQSFVCIFNPFGFQKESKSNERFVYYLFNIFILHYQFVVILLIYLFITSLPLLCNLYKRRRSKMISHAINHFIFFRYFFGFVTSHNIKQVALTKEVIYNIKLCNNIIYFHSLTLLLLLLVESPE